MVAILERLTRRRAETAADAATVFRRLVERAADGANLAPKDVDALRAAMAELGLTDVDLDRYAGAVPAVRKAREAAADAEARIAAAAARSEAARTAHAEADRVQSETRAALLADPDDVDSIRRFWQARGEAEVAAAEFRSAFAVTSRARSALARLVELRKSYPHLLQESEQ